jgi:hypothetical protein
MAIWRTYRLSTTTTFGGDYFFITSTMTGNGDIYRVAPSCLSDTVSR